jgi:hypothetical protein
MLGRLVSDKLANVEGSRRGITYLGICQVEETKGNLIEIILPGFELHTLRTQIRSLTT